MTSTFPRGLVSCSLHFMDEKNVQLKALCEFPQVRKLETGKARVGALARVAAGLGT